MAVLGVDACKGGWVGIRLDGASAPTAYSALTVESLVALAGSLTVIGIDIPIGLPASGAREADALARRAVGPRASSVFATPPKAVLQATTHAEATALCKQMCGAGVSQQAFALGRKILEVDEWLHRVDLHVVEVHPEVSFATLAGGFLAEPKSTWAGFDHRRRLLAGAGIVLDGDLGLAGVRASTDDVLDAAVAAWSAERVSRGSHVCLPDPPEIMADGRRAAIRA
jgi:predicted RNase H-like nuclease